MLIIALTGGIGSGKTTVSDVFKSKNIPVIDTDIIARQIVEQGKPAYTEIITLFGKEILDKDGNINREKLRKLIFASEKKRLQLENILHPLIWNEVKVQLELLLTSYLETPAYCIIVIPLLVENISQAKPVTFDRILVIDTTEEEQIKRAKNRDNCDETMIKNIINNQVSRQTRINVADDIILNTGNLADLNEKIDNLHQLYLSQSNNLSR